MWLDNGMIQSFMAGIWILSNGWFLSTFFRYHWMKKDPHTCGFASYFNAEKQELRILSPRAQRVALAHLEA